MWMWISTLIRRLLFIFMFSWQREDEWRSQEFLEWKKLRIVHVYGHSQNIMLCGMWHAVRMDKTQRFTDMTQKRISAHVFGTSSYGNLGDSRGISIWRSTNRTTELIKRISLQITNAQIPILRIRGRKMKYGNCGKVEIGLFARIYTNLVTFNAV